MKKEIDFTVEGIKGDLKLIYAPFSQKLYQDGQHIKPKKGKYPVITDSGDTEDVKIQYGLDFVHTIQFRGNKLPLEERLSTAEYIIGCLPVLLILLGGLIGALIGFFGAMYNYNYMRQEKRIGMQLLMSVGISVLCTIAYFALAIPFTLIFQH
ncbi:hypothetical protein [Parabacteroides bouchesdurhonensis]|uniref:hypothetical protein n=1 Tax=Parabacteroides bouchesdurhonensis TaxID=1936995 RepID=UPI000E473FD6|nr:hypothetical protein [Parabacteroides bouchesdurhonensis]RHJ90484.1 hypothetical protein DW095_12580 [Bacteroides sp. AM07-16]